MGNTQFIWGNAKRASYIRQANTKGFQASLDYMPESPLRHFLQWIIEQPNTQLYDRWARLNGMLPVARMTDEVLSGLFPDDMMLKLVDASIPLNVLLTYEVISDNLAIYLTKESTEHPEYQTRAKLLNAFNTIMVQKLRNPGLDTKACLGLHCDLMNTISSYHHSLSANTHRAIHQEYILEYPDADTKALEYDLFPHLVANIEAAANVLNYLKNHQAFELIRDGLCWRYEGSDAFITRTKIPNDELQKFGTYSIMVIPTLAYYASVIAEDILQLPAFSDVIKNGSLLEALNCAALHVRLLNDGGTQLLEADNDTTQKILNQLKNRQDATMSFEETLLSVAKSSGTLLTRLQKDIEFGEYNMILYPTYGEENFDKAVERFASQLKTIQQLYQTQQQQFPILLEKLNQQLGTDSISTVFTRFVQFHQKIYSAAFNTPQGEYAI